MRSVKPCEAYIASQKAEGWLASPDRYDDAGLSGGTLERPALQRLMREVEARRIDIVVTYKLDRLSRSLTDFVKLIELFDQHGVTFISITQQFSTTTSMGRLTLNILLSFAQFERELASERIRDKFAASRKRGLWMGGNVPLGYRVEARKLVVVESEAALVRRIFTRFAALGSALQVARELNAAGEVTKRWRANGLCAAAGHGPRATSTRSSATGRSAGRRFTRARPTPASMPPSLTRSCGTGRTVSWQSRLASALPRPGHRCRCS